MIFRRLQFFLLLLGLSVAVSALAATQYQVQIDTSAVQGAAGAIAFDFTSNSQNNEVTIHDFTTDGVTGLPETQGGLVSGDIVLLLNPAPQTIIEGGSFFNELVVPFTSFGTSTTFTVELTENPPTGDVPDEFSFFFLNTDRNRFFPTADPQGANALFAICITGDPGGLLGVFSPTTFVAPSQIKIVVVPPANLLNISTRARVLTGDNVLIGGFIITGAELSTPKKVVIRAIGPSLSNATPPVPGVLADPVLELHKTVGGINTILASNDNWKTNSAADQMTITDSGLDKYNALPISDLESILVATLPSVDPNVIGSGEYTAIVRGQGGATGVALVEVYDLDDPTTTTTELANISTRGLVGTGDNVMIGGIIVGPASNAGEVIVRAIGPSLAGAGVADPLLDPTLDLHDSNGAIIASNDNWMDSPDKQTIIDDHLVPTNDAESALLATLPAGAYTAIVSGVGGTTGVALVEGYHVSTPAAKQ